MVDMMNTDFKPGDIVQHPEHGYGVVLKNFPGVPTIYFAGKHGYENTTRGFTGWERAESKPPADEQRTSTTVTLPCPNCGEAITRTAQVWTGSQRDRTLTWVTLGWHTCPHVKPDEPTEFGARVTVTLPEGTPEKWLRVVSGDDWPWRNSDGGRHFWAYLIERGAVTLGWDE